MEMEMSMEEDEYSFDSNTDAIIYGVSDPSGSDQSLISDPNISSPSSSDDDISHHEQQQIQISTAVAPVIGISDDLSVSSSGWITNNNNNNKQIEEKEAAIMIFNVDFGALSRVAVHNEERKKLNSCEQIVKDPFSEPTQDDEPINWEQLESPWLEDIYWEILKSPWIDDIYLQLKSPWLEDIFGANKASWA